MTPQGIGALTAVIVLIILLAAMSAGWRRQARASALVVPEPPTAPADPGAARTPPMAGTYVSTTGAGDWLDRVVAHDLGARSQAVVQVHDAGVAISRAGARDVFVPREALVAVQRTPGMAGKYVGGTGLVVLRWQVQGTDGPVTLDTGLHLRNAADRDTLTAVAGELVQDRPENATADDVHPSSEERA